ncbi:MAG TPA: hypothetical protein VHD35_02715 [Chitinophagaceae bacterium]|nr:hypothetical protein [Chitinophagaceae bacterium]
MSQFPRTNTAYNLASEYCTIQRIKDYQEAYFATKAGRTPRINIKLVFQNALDSFHSMADEFKQIMKENTKYSKEKLIITLRKYAQNENLIHFRVNAATIIEDFNDPLPIKLIQTGEVLNDYFKDGFIVTHDFISTANYLLKDYIDPELIIHPEEDEIPKRANKKPQSIKKIKTKFTIGQLAYLFRLLYDNDFTHVESQAELAKFVANHFQNNRSVDFDLDNLKNLISSPNKNDAEKIADWLKELMIKARNFELKSGK